MRRLLLGLALLGPTRAPLRIGAVGLEVDRGLAIEQRPAEVVVRVREDRGAGLARRDVARDDAKIRKGVLEHAPLEGVDLAVVDRLRDVREPAV